MNLKRHCLLLQRVTKNLKRTRAAVDESALRSFITNLGKEIQDVPPTDIWNFGETNIKDNPEKRESLLKGDTNIRKPSALRPKFLSQICVAERLRGHFYRPISFTSRTICGRCIQRLGQQVAVIIIALVDG